MPKGETDLYERPRAVVQDMLKPDRHLDRSLDSRERNLVSTNATYSGLLSSLGAGVVSGALVAAANTFSPRFRGALGVSGKTALIVTPTAGAFFLSSQLAINGVTKGGGTAIAASTAEAPPGPTVTSLPLWCRAANQVYESPFKTIIAICAPAYGALFYHESTHPATAHMLLSQRLIHTRVYGQAIAVGTAVAVFAFSKTMDGEGAYRVVEGKVGRQADLVRGQKMRHWYSDLGKDKVHADGSADMSPAIEPAPDKELNANLLMPLIYVPLIPLVVIGLRGRVAPVTLQRISMGMIGSGLFHAGTIMFTDSSITMD